VRVHASVEVYNRHGIPVHRESSIRYEGWRVAAASAVGLSFAAYVPYVFPLFLKPLSEEFGWSREAISSALGVYAMVTALCAAPLGFMVDRFGPTRIVPVALTLFGCVFASLAVLTADLRHLLVVFALLGAIVTGMLPIAFAPTVATWFEQRRGLALALAISGGSIGGLLQPPAVQFLLGQWGWRTTCVALGAIVLLVGVPVAYAGIRAPARGRAARDAGYAGVDLSEALSSRVFWTITAAFFCSTLVQYGAVVHLSALLTDRGVSAAQAALALSAFGAASLAGRLVAGTLLDRYFAARVACGLLLAASAGALLLVTASSLAAGTAAAFLIGFGTAGESDVVPYLLTRYFGLRSCSTVYGVAWMATSIGAAAGPMLMGRAFDATGSYETALLGVSAAVFAAAMLMLTMPQYAPVRPMPVPTG
jgi:predicted MFS family arabinose efflux permease